MIGDVNANALIQPIDARFGDWKGRGPAGGDPQPVMKKPASPDVSVLVTAGAPDTSGHHALV